MTYAMKCSNCGRTISDISEYCPDCGTKIGELGERNNVQASSSQTHQEPSAPGEKSTFIAFLLSMFVPGLGHAYASSWGRGAMFFFLGPILVPVILIIGGAMNSAAVIVFSMIFFIAVWFYCLYDVCRVTKEYNENLRPV